jgi:hypothetical protein
LTQQTALPYSFEALKQSGPGVETRFQLAMNRRNPAAFLCASFSAAVCHAFCYGGFIWAAFGAGRSSWRFSTPFKPATPSANTGGGFVLFN